jgi:hypothetical protein
MTRSNGAIFKIPTKSPQRARTVRLAAEAKPQAARVAAGRVAGVETRAATRGGGEVIELDLGITVYPPRGKGGRWRAVWHEDGDRKQCESVSEDKLAEKLDKIRQRIAMGASHMTRPGADLIAWYLNPDRLPVENRWSCKHADSQRRLCQRFAAPVIGGVACQDITVRHTQKIVNAAPTVGEGVRLTRFLWFARCPRYADRDQVDQSARTTRSRRTTGADQAGNVPGHVDPARRRPPDRL